jgi:hypothetical protein
VVIVQDYCSSFFIGYGALLSSMLDLRGVSLTKGSRSVTQTILSPVQRSVSEYIFSPIGRFPADVKNFWKDKMQSGK